MFSVVFSTNQLLLLLKLKDIWGMTNMTYLKVLLRGQSVGCTRSVYLSQGQFVQAPELSRHYSIITASMFPLMSSSVFTLWSNGPFFVCFSTKGLHCLIEQWSLELTGCNMSIWLAMMFCVRAVVHVLIVKDDKRWASNLSLM